MTIDLHALQALPATSTGSATAATAAPAATAAATLTPAMELALSSNFASAATCALFPRETRRESDESLLPRRRLGTAAQALERRHGALADRRHRMAARAHRLAVDVHGPGAALDQAATELGTVQLDLIAQHADQW